LIHGLDRIVRIGERLDLLRREDLVHLLARFADPLRPLLEEWQEVRARLAEEFHRRAGLIRRVFECRDAFRERLELFIGRKTLQVRDREAQCSKCQIGGLRSARGLRKRHLHLLECSGERGQFDVV
jgi:hypothetical protein